MGMSFILCQRFHSLFVPPNSFASNFPTTWARTGTGCSVDTQTATATIAVPEPHSTPPAAEPFAEEPSAVEPPVVAPSAVDMKAVPLAEHTPSPVAVPSLVAAPSEAVPSAADIPAVETAPDSAVQEWVGCPEDTVRSVAARRDSVPAEPGSVPLPLIPFGPSCSTLPFCPWECSHRHHPTSPRRLHPLQSKIMFVVSFGE